MDGLQDSWTAYSQETDRGGVLPAAGEMVQMMAVLELPPRLACSILVSLLSLNGT